LAEQERREKMLTRKEELIQKMVSIGFPEERAAETYARYAHENKSEDLEWYIRLCEQNAVIQRHSER
jgi:Holliday junction resolvasome RuvABC DNA-binding subunit